LVLTIRRLLSALAIMGLVIGPVTKPAISIADASDSMAAMEHSDIGMEASTSMGEMPCCTDEIPAKSGCVKDCPLMALCMAKTMQNVTGGFAWPVQFVIAAVLLPGDEQDPASLLRSPPARPPKT